ncbi:MAG: hypothetical protein DRP91_00070 [Candidatus Neomarinimicrobiota bacterium]|nr:septum formation initiator family protein [Candidatus Neomarinimicrobiota bacterium]RKY50975.1 MAG: hypothetical protein DRP91_00070 [Candidatus Neomarinimicrobiota bacterium]RKY51942.1 MAG: hypothetical protein DRP92_06445 [Candidatus Neomarinimicrobiota bacterium]
MRAPERRGKNNTNTKKLAYLLGVILAICVLAVSFFAGDYGITQVIKLKRLRSQLSSEIEELRRKQDSLKAERLRLERDLRYIEKIAREKYRMAKEGERVFKVIEK